MMIFRLCTTEILYPWGDLGYVASFAFLFSLTSALWNFSRTHTWVCFYFAAFYILAAYTKRWGEMILQEREITHTIGTAIILFSTASFLYNTSLKIKNVLARKLLKAISYITGILFLLPPMIFLGYAFVNNSIFSTDIMLTLFQTNPEEIVSYLQDKNQFLWLIGSMVIILLSGLYLWFFLKLKQPCSSKFLPMATISWLLYVWICIMPKLNLCFLINIMQTTYATLQSFDDFKAQRQIRLENLKSLNIKNEQQKGNGVYILVIGESATRDHMHVYGYERQTTPWLTKFATNPNMIIFSNAYSNHVHTVPTLTYALSEQNQYHEVELSKAYSLIELAKAFGYKTYWFSNQPRYSLCDTPITVIGSMTDEAVWLNTNTGDKLSTSYYDEKLVEYITALQGDEKSLIVVHLMGSHGAYRDRYPSQFAQFKKKNRRVDSYDNSILYTDHVLQLIYQAAVKHSNFMAMIYMSDHGEDPDNGLGHESSRFSLPMAEIPFFAYLLPQYISSHHDHLSILHNNKDKVWTNDLLFDFMLSLMDININDVSDDRFNVLSSKYDLPADEVRLLHGQKKLNTVKFK